MPGDHNPQTERFEQYGISHALAQRATMQGLSLGRVRELRRAQIVELGFSEAEATTLKNCVIREPITSSVMLPLLQRSNYTCNVCKNKKGLSYIIHHIVPYVNGQSNQESNLVVLCPTCHDRAHLTPEAITLTLKADELRYLKKDWQKQVGVYNAHKAAGKTKVSDLGIDYLNVPRIEEYCTRVFGSIPTTTMADSLVGQGILNSNFTLNHGFIEQKYPNRRYLFDFACGEGMEHYRQLVEALQERAEFFDLNNALSVGEGVLSNTEGTFTYFTGLAKGRPIESSIHQGEFVIALTHVADSADVEWVLDPYYVQAMSAFRRLEGEQRYAIYGSVNSVSKYSEGEKLKLQATPLLVAPPSGWMVFGDMPLL